MDRLEAFFESLFRLSSGQWTVILTLLACANAIVFGALGWLLYAYVFNLPPTPTEAVQAMPVPTLRPTYTPTWTPMPTPTPSATATRTPSHTWREPDGWKS